MLFKGGLHFHLFGDGRSYGIQYTCQKAFLIGQDICISLHILAERNWDIVIGKQSVGHHNLHRIKVIIGDLGNIADKAFDHAILQAWEVIELYVDLVTFMDLPGPGQRQAYLTDHGSGFGRYDGQHLFSQHHILVL